MLRFICAVILLQLSSNSFAQNCDSYVVTTKDTAGEITVSARRNINVSGKDGKAFDIASLTTLNTVVVVIGVSGGYKCVGANDLVEVMFTDQSTLKVTNSYENCASRSVLYFSPAHRNMDLLAQLSQKSIASVTVWTKIGFVTLAFDGVQATQFASAVKCLASNINVPLDYKGDSVQQAVKPHYEVDSTKVYTSVETLPEFPGGNEEMLKFLMKNMKGFRAKHNGTVVISFIVDEKGMMKEHKVIKSVGPKEDAEVMRVLKLMPPWIPAKQHGVPVKSLFNFPFKFRNDSL